MDAVVCGSSGYNSIMTPIVVDGLSWVSLVVVRLSHAPPHFCAGAAMDHALQSMQCTAGKERGVIAAVVVAVVDC